MSPFWTTKSGVLYFRRKKTTTVTSFGKTLTPSTFFTTHTAGFRSYQEKILQSQSTLVVAQLLNIFQTKLDNSILFLSCILNTTKTRHFNPAGKRQTKDENSRKVQLLSIEKVELPYSLHHVSWFLVNRNAHYHGGPIEKNTFQS